jgi:hypothetical protein
MGDFLYTYPEDYWDLELPVNGSHDSFFSSVGFIFGSFENGDLTRPTKLPLGWQHLRLKGGRGLLLDERKVARVITHMKNQVSFMHPVRRFRVEKIEKDKLVEFVVWDRDVPHPQKEKKVFSQQYSVPSRSKHPNIYKQRVEQYATKNKCEKWLGDNFPSWNDYDAYWGKPVKT